MKTKKVLSGIVMACTIAIFMLSSCSKEDAGSISNNDIMLAQDEAYADALYEEVDNLVISNVTSLDANHFSPVGFKSTGDEGDCAVITVDHPDTSYFPKVITLDFGDGCTRIFRDDTITWKGQIIITLTDRWFVKNARHIVTFNNFFINDVRLEGTRTFTNLGLNEKNHLELEIKLEDGRITFNDTAWMTRNADHIREWIRSFYPLNDTILITGSASGINIEGEEYERLITVPLVMVHCEDYHWRWVIVDGTIQITKSGSDPVTIDYSSTGCDGMLNIGMNGHHHSYQFRYRHHNHWQRH